MDLSPIDAGAELSSDAIAMWEALTADFYVDALQGRTDLDPPISEPEVTVSLIFSARPNDDSTGQVLAMQYRATASFLSDSTSYDPGLLTLPAFQDQSAVLQYVVQLRQSGHAVFENLMSLSLTVNAATAIPAPTPSPTQATAAPTKVPTLAPTTKSPTRTPTGSPTVSPTTFPVTSFPTTRGPTFSLTASPIQTQTPAPTVTSTNADTVEDSDFDPDPDNTDDNIDTGGGDGNGTDTNPDTPMPSAAPSLSPPTVNLQTKYATTSLVFQYVPSDMQDSVLEDWKRVTISYLEDYIQTLDPTLLQHENTLQIEKVVQGQVTRRHRYMRTLQDNSNSSIALSVEFVTKLELPPDVDANSLVNGAFSTRARRVLYLAWLIEVLGDMMETEDVSQESVFFFADLEDILYVSDTTAGITDDDDNNNDPNQVIQPPTTENGSSAGTIVGGVVGGLAAILLIAALVLRSKGSKGGSKDLTSSDGGINSENANQTKEMSPTTGNGTSRTAAGLTWEPAEQPSRLNQEILVQDSNYDDVSTIGDPFLYGQPSAEEQEDEKTATTSVLQTDTYNSLLGRSRLQHEQSFTRSQGDDTEFSAFTGMSKYMGIQSQPPSARTKGLLGELGLDETDETSFEQRLFPMDKEEEHEQGTLEERSLDYSLPTALM